MCPALPALSSCCPLGAWVGFPGQARHAKDLGHLAEALLKFTPVAAVGGQMAKRFTSFHLRDETRPSVFSSLAAAVPTPSSRVVV